MSVYFIISKAHNFVVVWRNDYEEARTVSVCGGRDYGVQSPHVSWPCYQSLIRTILNLNGGVLSLNPLQRKLGAYNYV